MSEDRYAKRGRKEGDEGGQVQLLMFQRISTVVCLSDKIEGMHRAACARCRRELATLRTSMISTEASNFRGSSNKVNVAVVGENCDRKMTRVGFVCWNLQFSSRLNLCGQSFVELSILSDCHCCCRLNLHGLSLKRVSNGLGSLKIDLCLSGCLACLGRPVFSQGLT